MSNPFRRALARWLAQTEQSGLEAMFTDPEPACPIPVPHCRVCRVCPPEPATNRGRHESYLDAVADVCRWLQETAPEAWLFAEPHEVGLMAWRLLRLREGVEAGRWHVEAVV